MIARTSPPLPPAPPPLVMEEIRRRFSERELQALEAVLLLRATAQQAENTVTEWMAGTVGSTARWQILMHLWASKGRGMPHKDIVASMGVTRATISGLMAALEREGFVKSSVDRDDRRQLLATLTARGEAVMNKAIEANKGRLSAVFASFSHAELATLMALLHRVRNRFVTNTNTAIGNMGKIRDKTGMSGSLRRPALDGSAR